MCMKIALTNLGKYNEGVLDFTWLSLPATEKDIAAAFDKINVSHDDIHYYSNGLGEVTTDDTYGEYEEYFITDYECDFYRIGEYENIDTLNDLASEIESLEDYEQDIVKALMSEYGYNLEDAIEKCADVIVYSGCDNMIDVAYEYVEETCMFHGLPDFVETYFDYKSFGRDLSFDGQWFEVDGSMAVLY